MKSKKLLIVILFIAILTLIRSNKVKTSSRVMSHALFSVSDSNLKISGPGDISFKGKVVLDTTGKGIIISSGEDSHGESLMRLVSEKLDNDSYLIDFRLMRSCDFDLRFTDEEKTNLSISFSPRSMENRNKNDHFDLMVEIDDPKLFLSNSVAVISENRIKNYLKSKCEARKASVSETKTNFVAAIENFQREFRELTEIKKKLKNQKTEVDNLQAAITDTGNQIKDITYLQKNYDIQLKSIDSLTSGSSKLRITEVQKKEELDNKLKATHEKISEIEKNIKEKEEEAIKEKEKYTKTLEQSKDAESLIINFQKDLSDLDNQIANSKSNKLRLDFDLKSSNEEKKKNDKSLTEIMVQTEQFKIKQNENKLKIVKMRNEKNKMENDIFKEKEEIKQIEQAINDLILKKSKKEESLKKRYDDVKAKKEDITTLKIEMEKYTTEIKKLSENKEQIENVRNIETAMKIKSITKKMKDSENESKQLNEKAQKVNEILRKQYQKKEKISTSLEQINKKIAEKSENIVDQKNEKNGLEKMKADIISEIKSKEEKMSNLEKERANYRTEVENVKNSLNLTQKNIKTFDSILTDFRSKLTPVEAKYNEYLTQKSTIEAQVKASKRLIKDIASKMKSDVKSAMVMIDMAEDEAFNIDEESVESTESKGNKKYRSLIEQIIS